MDEATAVTNGKVQPSEQKVEELLTDDRPITAGYRPMLPLSGWWLDDSTGPDFFQLGRDVYAMLVHPRVIAALNTYKSGISNAKFSVPNASHPKVADFALSELERFWARNLSQAQRCYDHGRRAGELMYRTEDGLLRLDRIEDFQPQDAVALSQEGQLVGIRVRNVERKGRVDLWGARKYPAKGWWAVHNHFWNKFYGLTQCYGAWRPWRRLAGRDGAEEVVDAGTYRFAFAGPVLYYPVRDFKKNQARGTGASSSVDPENARQYAMQFAENAKAGVGVGFPNTTVDGKREWELVWPQHVLDVKPLDEHCQYLERQISLGIGVPPELQEATEVGSGYSGRAIPLEGFYNGQQINAQEMVKMWKEQIGDPLVWWNFGPDHWFEVTIEPLLQTKLEMGKQLMGQQAGGEAANAPTPGSNLDQRGHDSQKPPLANQGARTAPATAGSMTFSLRSEVEAAAADAKQPTEGQKEAGNYRKGHISIQGLPITIENAKGSTRSGESNDGKKWSVKMAHHYGYIKRTESEADGDHIDVFIGDEPGSEIVFVINQLKPSGRFDEHKCMLGFTNQADAAQGYLACYSAGWKGLGSIRPMTMADFREWVEKGDTKHSVTLATRPEEPPLPFDEDPEVQALIRRAQDYAARLNETVRRELLKAISKGTQFERLVNAGKVLDNHQGRLAAIVGQTRLASLLLAMKRVAARLPPEEFPTTPTEPSLPPEAEVGGIAAPPPPISPPGPSPEAADWESVRFPVIDEAVRDLESRRLFTRPQFDGLTEEARRDAFTVAGIENENVLETIRNTLAETVKEGGDVADFNKSVKEKLGTGTFLSPNHAETVFRTNAFEGYSRGLEKVLEHPLVDPIFPYADFFPTHDDRVRPEHLALEKFGINGSRTFRRDDPVWEIFRPPFDWQCRCAWNPISVIEAARRGIAEAQHFLDHGTWPAQKAWVPMPPFRPSPRFRRDLVMSLETENAARDAHYSRLVWSSP